MEAIRSQGKQKNEYICNGESVIIEMSDDVTKNRMKRYLLNKPEPSRARKMFFWILYRCF